MLYLRLMIIERYKVCYVEIKRLERDMCVTHLINLKSFI